jgi:hypothetical protein
LTASTVVHRVLGPEQFDPTARGRPGLATEQLSSAAVGESLLPELGPRLHRGAFSFGRRRYWWNVPAAYSPLYRVNLPLTPKT